MADPDWLEEALKEPEAYLENEGFSHGVMQALPPRRRRTRISRRKRIVSTAGLIGVVGFLPFVSTTVAIPGLHHLVASPWFMMIASMGFLGVVAVVAWWLFAVRE